MSPLKSRLFFSSLLVAVACCIANTQSACAADLVIERSGYVLASSRLQTTSKINSYELARGWTSGTMTQVTSSGYSGAAATSSLQFNGPSNAQRIEFTTFANPSSSHRDAFSQMYTSPNASKYGDLRVTVRPTGRDRKGDQKTVKITIKYQSTVSGRANGTYNKLHLAINSGDYANILTSTNAVQSKTVTGRVNCGQTFNVRFLGESAAAKNTTARMVTTVDLSVN